MLTTVLCDHAQHRRCMGAAGVYGDVYVEGVYEGEKWIRAACECACHHDASFGLASSTSPAQKEYAAYG